MKKLAIFGKQPAMIAHFEIRKIFLQKEYLDKDEDMHIFHNLCFSDMLGYSVQFE